MCLYLCVCVCVCVCVTQLLPKRLQPPRLGVMALLEQEVFHLEDPSAYIALPFSLTPDSALHTDLLLGTQASAGYCLFMCLRHKCCLIDVCSGAVLVSGLASVCVR